MQPIKSLQAVSDVFEISNEDNYKILSFKKEINNVLVLDQGLQHTALCKSNISKIDGENGKLFYRGIEIEKVIENNSFEDIAFELIFDKEISLQDKTNFKNKAARYFYLSKDLKQVLDNFPISLHPMDFLSMGVISLSALEPNEIKENNNTIDKVAYLIAQTSVIATYYFLKSNNENWVDIGSDEPLSYQILSHMFHNNKEYPLNEFSEILSTLLILHAEHELNCSTTTVRNIASSGGDIYNAIACGISAFKGKLHGGASQYVAEMYEEIIVSNIKAEDYVNQKIQNKARLMGFGHRVYNCWDPRAKIMFNLLKSDNESFVSVNNYKEIMLSLVKRVDNDEYFKSRSIYPNPDLLNCIFFKLLGFPSTMNTVILSLSRIAGWIAHYYEHINDNQPIIRPRQISK
ncbi:MAG: citrate/2-methylcitrate synthase [Sphingobacteriia bacterium]|nr:citrate/2-methylcitrate synthase [Sphingobacteriia bacterium]